jgi:hypothetical protein
MQRLPQEDLREALSIVKTPNGIDNQTALCAANIYGAKGRGVV